MPARNELTHGHLQIATRILFGTLRWTAGDTPCFWEAGFIIRQSDSGRGGMEMLAHYVTGGSCPAARSSYRSLKWRLSSFPPIQASRRPAFPVANASKEAGSFSEMPEGCRILASSGTLSQKHRCLGGGGPFSVWDLSSLPKAGSAGRTHPASHKGVRWCMAKWDWKEAFWYPQN